VDEKARVPGEHNCRECSRAATSTGPFIGERLHPKQKAIEFRTTRGALPYIRNLNGSKQGNKPAAEGALRGEGGKKGLRQYNLRDMKADERRPSRLARRITRRQEKKTLTKRHLKKKV